MTKITNADRIREEIQTRFRSGLKNGFSSVSILASELHENVDFNEGSHPNQMPSICNMMHEAKRSGDEVLYSPPKGRGGKLHIR